MGRGIAALAAGCGLETTILGRRLDSAAEARARILADLSRRAANGKVTAEEVLRTEAHLKAAATEDFNFRTVDFVIESIAENIKAKMDVFRHLGAETDDITLASNTSSLSIARLGAASGSPGRVIGMHFFNPPAALKLVEIASGMETTSRARADAEHLATLLGRAPIHVKDVAGFVVNRVLFATFNEACRAERDGIATRTDIDQGLKVGLAHPMGPFALMDLIGLDVCQSIFEALSVAHGDTFLPPPQLRQMVERGRLGKKVRAGFYDYP